MRINNKYHWLGVTVMLLAVMGARGDDDWQMQVGGAYQWNTHGCDQDFNAAGVAFAARHDMLNCCGLNVGVDFDLAWFPDMQASQTHAVSSLYRTYSYDGPNIIITDTLDQSVVTTKADLYRVRAGLGPTLSVPITDQLSLYVTPQFTMSLVHAEVTRNQTGTSTDMGTGNTTVLSSSEANNDKTAFLSGVLLAAGLDYHITSNWVVGAYIGHEWIPDTLSVCVGSDRMNFNLGGSEASVYVGIKI